MTTVSHSTKIAAGQPTFTEKEYIYLMDCMNSTRLTMGKWVERFERQFAQFIGVKHAVTVNNGTAALHLALAALGIGAGDEVILPSLTFIATANAVQYTGATPVFVDVDPNTWNIEPNEILNAITEKTRAILPVHLYGSPANLTAIQTIADVYNLYVIEDAAESLGACSKGVYTGVRGDVAAFSFYGNKTITTGEGGMITTNQDGIAQRARLLRGQGQTPGKRYWHEVVGFNYRMTDLQAAVGCAQLENVEQILQNRARAAATYKQILPKEWQQKVYPGDLHGNWAFAVIVPGDRDAIMQELDKAGIETRPTFPLIHTMPPYRTGQHLPKSAHISAQGIVLPTHAELTAADVYFVSEKLLEAAQLHG
jgi:perosamine synthetase